MTAEIAICNRNGIALAADSAVSMFDGQKIYNSANKLFSLSKHHPVAVMVYNSASLLNVPWEIVIKQYREHLGNHSYSTLQEYSESFWNFIDSKTEWFPDSDIDEAIQNKIFRYTDRLIEEALHILRQKNTDVSDTQEIKKTVSEKVNEYKTDADSLAFLDEFNEADIEQALKNHRDVIEGACKTTLEGLYDLLEDSDRNKLLLACATILTKNTFDRYSGIVIAGFGDSEITPRIASYQAGIYANGKLRKSFLKGLSNIHDQKFSPAIYPFAQDDVVRSFITGIDPEIANFVSTTITDFPQTFLKSIDKVHLAGNNDGEKEAHRQDIEQHLAGLTVALMKKFEEATFELGTKSLYQMLQLLPKDELAEMAESLIHLTAFKRRMSASLESVGGPIDVAILSKGDGLIWVKRKHYFQPELNQHFFHNYFKD